jgi:ElaB/YqjD/DUF883 family membrane-anchored ribosome-binding protein
MGEKSSNMSKISEALQILDEAAMQEKDSIQDMLRDRYHHLKNVVIAAEHSLGDSVSQARDAAYEKAMMAKEYSIATAKKVDRSAHDNPWMYIAGFGLFGLFSGYLLGKSSKR